MKLTIFTPTYNRGKLLIRVFQSLLRQDCFDFEWLIIDDGSTDDTESIVNGFVDNGQFSVRYYKKNNGGKHRAHNFAVNLAQGEYFLCLDSDDWLSDCCVKTLLSELDECESQNGLIAYKESEKGELLSTVFPCGITITTITDLEVNHHCIGEVTVVYPVEILKVNPFPEIENETFMLEGVLYDQLSKICKMRLLPKVICICEYQDNGYTSNINNIMKKNPVGFCLRFMQQIDVQKSIIKKTIISGKYNCFCLFAKGKQPNYSGESRFLVVITKPLGWLFWLYYKTVRKF